MIRPAALRPPPRPPPRAAAAPPPRPRAGCGGERPRPAPCCSASVLAEGSAPPRRAPQTAQVFARASLSRVQQAHAQSAAAAAAGGRRRRRRGRDWRRGGRRDRRCVGRRGRLCGGRISARRVARGASRSAPHVDQRAASASPRRRRRRGGSRRRRRRRRRRRLLSRPLLATRGGRVVRRRRRRGRRRGGRRKHADEGAAVGGAGGGGRLEAVGGDVEQRDADAGGRAAGGERGDQLKAVAREAVGARVLQRRPFGAVRLALQPQADDDLGGDAVVLLLLRRQPIGDVARELGHPLGDHLARVERPARRAAPPAKLLAAAHLLRQLPVAHLGVVAAARHPHRLRRHLLRLVPPAVAQQPRHRRHARPPQRRARLEAAVLAEQLAELGAEAAQPIDGQRVEQRVDGRRRQHRLLIGLVEAAAQLGEQLVGGDARRAREAELGGDRARARPTIAAPAASSPSSGAHAPSGRAHHAADAAPISRSR